tara:strand:- start:6692 stop:6973 length:282 start_codon:yes stop_codon:yes gene_type:complete
LKQNETKIQYDLKEIAPRHSLWYLMFTTYLINQSSILDFRNKQTFYSSLFLKIIDSDVVGTSSKIELLGFIFNRWPHFFFGKKIRYEVFDECI